MLACPFCHTPLHYQPNQEEQLCCTNPDCKLYHSSYILSNGIPILIPPRGEYSIINPEIQFRRSDSQLAGYKARQTNIRTLRFRHKAQDIFYGFSKLESRLYSLLYSHLPSKPKVLIVGGGNIDTSDATTIPWVSLFKKKEATFCVTDIYLSENVDYVCDAHYLPFESNYFDAVIVTTVLEHVLSPSKVVNEIYRVLNAHGYVYATVPFLQCVHEGAYDFSRFSLVGQRWLFRYFDEIKSDYLIGVCCSMLYNFSTFLSLLFRQKIIGIIIRLLFWRICSFADFCLPKSIHINQGLCNYFLGKKSSHQSIEATELPQYFTQKIS